MFWQGALPHKFANFKVQNDECHYFGLKAQKKLKLWVKFSLILNVIKDEKANIFNWCEKRKQLEGEKNVYPF